MLTSDALPDDVRVLLEERFWRPIEQAATIETLRERGARLDDPAHDPFLFADHGVAHVRDIARGVIELAEAANGVLLPRRSPERQRFLASYGIAVTYLHDIGMVDPTPEGRRIHPAFAAHVAFGIEFDEIIENLLLGPSPVVERLRHAHSQAPFDVPLPVVLRELLALTMAHSKTAVPAPLLDDPVALRRLVQSVVLTGLDELRAGAAPSMDAPWPAAVTRFYDDVGTEPFSWLGSGEPAHVELVDDVTDALRVLRSADALRQRGTTLRTAGGYEIFMEAATGEAVYALRSADLSAMYFVRVEGTRSAGEANIRTAWVTPSGQLRVSFHRGAYGSAPARARAVARTAEVVDDIQADVLPSFGTRRARLGLPPPDRDPLTMTIQLERPADWPGFAKEVAFDLLQRRPALAGRVAVVANLEDADPDERDRYHRATAIPPDSVEAHDILDALRHHGMSLDDIDVVEAFSDVRRIGVAAGEVLVAAGSAPAFVYVPTDPGLRVVPGGGYPPQPAGAWLPIGVTGVVRDAARNSDVVADRDVGVVMVPGELFVREWFRPTSAARLHGLLHD